MSTGCCKTRIFTCLLALIPLFTVHSGEHRDQWQQPERIMDTLQIREGMVIGEVGAGDGYFTFHLARRVGKDGHIYANDIAGRKLMEIEQRCQKENIKNITTILGKIEDPMFPREKLDMAVMMLVFHDLEKPIPLINNIIPALKTGAFLVIIDHDAGRISENRGHFFTREKVLDIMKKTKFELVRVMEFLPRDNIYIYQIRNE